MTETCYPHRSLEAREAYYAYYDKEAKRWPVPCQERAVETSFGATYMRISGPGDGPPLVLLPGDTETSLSWIPFIGTLSENYRTFAIDHVNDFGRSVSARPMKRPEDFVQWLDEVLQILDLEQVNLMGYSYGAWQASLYALGHPERLRKLVLLAPSATVTLPPVGILPWLVLYSLVPTRSVVTNYIYWLCKDEVALGGESKAAVDHAIDELLFSKKCYVRRKFVQPTVLTDKQWAALTMPTLLIVAENDKAHSARRGIDRMADVAPAVQTELLEGVGHHGVMILKSGWITERVLRFLEDTDS